MSMHFNYLHKSSLKKKKCFDVALLHPLSRSPFCVACYLDVCVVWIVYLQTALPHLEQIQPSRALQHSTELWANSLRATQTGTQTIRTRAHSAMQAKVFTLVARIPLTQSSTRSASLALNPLISPISLKTKSCFVPQCSRHQLQCPAASKLSVNIENPPKVTVWMA